LHRQFGTSRLPKLREHPLASKYINHLLASVTGLIKQLEISSMVNKSSATGTKTLQTTLRLLKIWFQHGNLPEIQSILKEGVERIDLKVWIEVIPQLLARIDIKDEIIRKTLIELVEKISLKFP
jgi:FKBP12-rapamycin complex-associated protein